MFSKSTRSSSSLFFDWHNRIGIKYITHIRLGLSHLREHKFRRRFNDTINPICNCVNDVESAIHFFLNCLLYSNERRTFLSRLVNIDDKLFGNANCSLTQTLLFDNTTFNVKDKTKIINLTIDYIMSAKISDGPLL